MSKIPQPENTRAEPVRVSPVSFRRQLLALGALGALAAGLAAQNIEARRIDEFVLRLPGIDKVGHAIEYALVFAIVWWLAGLVVPDRAKRLIVAIGVASGLAIAEESLQRTVANRHFELADLLMNACGIVAAVALGPGRLRRPMMPLLLTASLATTVVVTFTSHRKLRDYNRGLLYERAHEYGRAREHYQRALRAGLRSPGLYNALAWVEIESGIGSPAQAVDYGRQALAMRPNNPDFLDTYGWALHHAGRSAEALPILERAIALKPRIFSIHYHLGAVYRAVGQIDKARVHLRRQMDLSPGSPEARRAGESLHLLDQAPGAPAAAGGLDPRPTP